MPGSDMATGEAITEGLPPASVQVNGPQGVTIYMYYWLNLLRGKQWSLKGNSHVVSQAYNASSDSLNMLVKNRLCQGGSCSAWTRTKCSNCVWVWAGWWREGGRTNWTTRGIHTFWPFGTKRTFRTTVAVDYSSCPRFMVGTMELIYSHLLASMFCGRSGRKVRHGS